MNVNKLQLDFQQQLNVATPHVSALLPIGGVGEMQGLSNDDFFHLIRHIDQNLKEKIQRGDYVDLDELLM